VVCSWCVFGAVVSLLVVLCGCSAGDSEPVLCDELALSGSSSRLLSAVFWGLWCACIVALFWRDVSFGGGVAARCCVCVTRSTWRVHRVVFGMFLCWMMLWNVCWAMFLFMAARSVPPADFVRIVFESRLLFVFMDGGVVSVFGGWVFCWLCCLKG